MNPTRILVVDDEPAFRRLLAEALSEEHEVIEAAGGAAALAQLDTGRIDLMLLDLKMPDVDGVEVFRRCRRDSPHVPVIVASGLDDLKLAVELIKQGAYYYFLKPLDLEQVRIIVGRALSEQKLAREVHQLRRQLAERGAFEPLIGRSPAMRELFETLAVVAPSVSTVLIQGESGTGKELVARAIHARSERAAGPFVAVSCGAIPETLMESELFGHERGAFTGAHSRRIGRFEAASGGTLFLDEVGEIPPATQVKLLRALQERVIERIGGGSPVEIDVRIVAATNRDLAAEVLERRFRKDLYYRLAVILLEIPPLRARREDILPLAQSFLARFAERERRPAPRFAPELLECLIGYDWPGNVRELENVIERAVVVAGGAVIERTHLPAALRGRGPGAGAPGDWCLPPEGLTLARAERALIERTLADCEGNKARAARRLGISRKTLYARLREYGAV